MIHQTGLLHHDLAAEQDNKVRYASNVEACGQLRMLVGVNLEHDCFASHLRRCSRDLGSRGATGSAPRGPEVDQDRYGSILDDFVEQGFIIYRKRLGERA